MALEAAQSAEAARRQIARCEGAFTELGERLRQRPPRFVVTCARGSSDHAASYGKYLIETTLGRAVASVGPSVASVYNTPGLELRESLFVAVSQSGRSPDLLRLTEAARAGGALVIGFVNNEDSPLFSLCDIGLPGMDGYEVARRVRAGQNGWRPYLVAVTGYGQPDDRRRALEAGFDSHLVKPVGPEELAGLLEGRAEACVS